MKPNPVGWFEIYVQDMPRARAFYERVLGTKLEPLPTPTPEIEMLIFPMDATSYGAPGALAKMEGMTAGGNSVMVYFSCDDCAVEGGRIAEAGGHLIKEKFSVGQYGFIVIASDSEGNVFGLHSQA
ncbi:VOC family protein [Aeoliella sp. SH292]|uniref:VOC family protein n=1 Tax=Aeoliella sp. SH292 TaxID=3454464 RepID=UPI003F991C5E